jgi:exopolysaccharide production protein ExoQ
MNLDRKFLVFMVLGGSTFILSKGLLVMFLVPDPPPFGGNPTTRLILTLSYLGVALILASRIRETLLVLRRNWVLLVLVLMSFASCLWAESPIFVLQRSIAVFGTTLLGIAFATRLSLEEQLRLMSWFFRTMAVLSLGCILFFPSYGISSSADSFGNWQGVFGYKNLLGAMMTVSILVERFRPADTPFAKLIKWSSLLLSGVLLAGSNSITPMIALGATLLFVEAYRVAKHRLRMPLYAIVVAALVLVAAGATAFVVDSNRVTGAVGRSSNLSGRTEIWSMVLSYISERPVLGYGYSGFWYGSSQESSQVDQALGTPIMYSHNGYLETLLNLGAVGFLLMLAFLGTGVTRAYYCSERDRSLVNLWPLAFLTFFLLYNTAECTILLQDLQWALCVSVVASADAALRVRDAEPEEEQSLVPVYEAT